MLPGDIQVFPQQMVRPAALFCEGPAPRRLAVIQQGCLMRAGQGLQGRVRVIDQHALLQLCRSERGVADVKRR
ncbi:hypothetical protein D3C73_1625450 [compost metagenome]